MEKVKERSKEPFSHFRNQGKAVADIKLMWMSPSKFSCNYLFIFLLES